MELMLAITEYNYFKPAAGVPAERSIHNPYFDYERNKKCTSITVIAGIVDLTSICTMSHILWLKIERETPSIDRAGLYSQSVRFTITRA